MIKETITQIEARIEKAESLNDAKKKELLDLLSALKVEVSELSKTHAEHSQSITGFTEVPHSASWRCLGCAKPGLRTTNGAAPLGHILPPQSLQRSFRPPSPP